MEINTLAEAFMYYGVRLVIFSAVAALGIFIGIKLRKAKNKKIEAEAAAEESK